MIKTFASKETAAIFYGREVLKFPKDVWKSARRKLAEIDQANHVGELRVPNSNRLEKLSGNLKGQYSIRINKQWRICFRFKNGNAYEVQIIDYH